MKPFEYASFSKEEIKSSSKRVKNFEFVKYYKDIEIKDSIKNQIDNLTNYMASINKFNVYVLGQILIKLSNKYFDKNSKDITLRTYEFFSKQKTLDINIPDDFNKFKSILHLQFTLVNNYTKMLGFLTKNNDVHYISTLVVKDNSCVDKLLETYVKSIKMYNFNEDKKDKPISDDIKENYDYLKNGIENIVSDLLKYDDKIICYGSYTSFNINPDIKYNDIDIYHTHSYYFLICLMICIEIITEISTEILHIPYITGHMALMYKGHTLLDCIYLDAYTMSFLKSVKINNKTFVNPGLQFLNNIKMSSEVFRLTNVYKNQEEYIKKNSVLLSYFLEQQNIKLDSIECSNLEYKIIGKKIILMKMPLKCEFDNLIIIQNPKELVDFIVEYNIPGKFSKKFHAFANDVYFESNKIEYEIQSLKSIRISDKIKKYNELNLSYTELYSYINNSKCLIMSNFASSSYISFNKIHEISIQSIFANVCNYFYLHNKEYSEEYFKYVLKLLTLKVSDINDYFLIRRQKRSGEHINISINPPVFSSIKFYQEPYQEYFDVHTFVNTIELMD